MADTLYPSIVMDGHIAEWLTDDWYWMLMLDTWLGPDPLTQEFVSDISGQEASVSRVLATGKTSDDNGGAVAWPVLGMDDVDFGSPNTGETASYVVLYREITTDADSPLAGAWLIDKPLNGSQVTIEFQTPYTDFLEYGPDGIWLLSGQAVPYSALLQIGPV